MDNSYWKNEDLEKKYTYTEHMENNETFETLGGLSQS